VSLASPLEILDFWFRETPPEHWFVADPGFDAVIRARFEESWREGREGAFQTWSGSRDGALALIILFDQFPRNMFRAQAEAFASDAMARIVAREAVERGFDLEVPDSARSFFYLPFMHSEDMDDQESCIRLTREGLGQTHFSYPYALKHRDVIARFGRFPARNAALQRASTPEETAFLRANPIGL
jgi:uncharacterized protein (DUF924 family)